jgi:uncharacterized cupredoxin-like copper-binding protein
MYRRFNGTIAVLISLPLLTTGCVQATRHSNMMIFGTNTSLGLKVGTDVAEVPGILVGYNRQEAVILPLVANTAGDKKLNRLDPCEIKGDIKVVTDGTSPQALGKLEPHPCLLVAIDKDGKARDSYSVLASFGANFGASQGTGVNAQGGLAQYFATGMAAQLLALNGGAAVVATGEAAKKSVEEPKMTLTGLTPTSADLKSSEIFAKDFSSQKEKLRVKMLATKDKKIKAAISDFESNIDGKKQNVDMYCGDDSNLCTNFIDNYMENFRANATKFSDAVENWNFGG